MTFIHTIEYAYMTEARRKHLAEMGERGIRLDRKVLTLSERKEVIAETALKDVDRRIATLRYLKAMTPTEIAGLLSYDERTIRRRLKGISRMLCDTLLKIISA